MNSSGAPARGRLVDDRLSITYPSSGPLQGDKENRKMRVRREAMQGEGGRGKNDREEKRKERVGW